MQQQFFLSCKFLPQCASATQIMQHIKIWIFHLKSVQRVWHIFGVGDFTAILCSNTYNCFHSSFLASGIQISAASSSSAVALRKLCEEVPFISNDSSNLEGLLWIGEVSDPKFVKCNLFFGCTQEGSCLKSWRVTYVGNSWLGDMSCLSGSSQCGPTFAWRRGYSFCNWPCFSSHKKWRNFEFIT